jgi:hypothetical protein
MTAGFRIHAIPGELAEHVRRHRTDPVYGHPVHAEPATGYGPCRVCLRPFREGSEERLLFTLDSFHGASSLPQPGPAFIHARECGRYAGGGFPQELEFLPLWLEGWGADGRLRRQDSAAGADADLAIADLLASPGVSFVQVRNAEAGCYLARAVRDGASSAPPKQKSRPSGSSVSRRER